MADEEITARLAEICDLLREQTRIAESSVNRAMRFQKISLVWIAGVAALVLTALLLWVWEGRGRAIEIDDLNAQELRLRIESEKRMLEQMERQPDDQRRPAL